MSSEAYVTLATNDGYAVGALVLGHSLLSVGTSKHLCILITPNVSDPVREQLSSVYHNVVVVDVLDSKDTAHLALLKRPELGVTFTKIHCWTLSQYKKCVFLDADMLAVQNPDELFQHSELSAACDVGWPDCFNSGMFVFTPSPDTYSKLVEHASKEGSFDGGDQGLLNTFFPNWTRISFLFNMVVSATYTYLPAYKQYGSGVKLVHFLGIKKPWQHPYDPRTGQVTTAPGYHHMSNYLNAWWSIYTRLVHPALPSLDIQKAAESKAPFELANFQYLPDGIGMESPYGLPTIKSPSDSSTQGPNEKEVKRIHYHSHTYSVATTEVKISEQKQKDKEIKPPKVIHSSEHVAEKEKKLVEDSKHSPSDESIDKKIKKVEIFPVVETKTKASPVDSSPPVDVISKQPKEDMPYQPYHPEPPVKVHEVPYQPYQPYRVDYHMDRQTHRPVDPSFYPEFQISRRSFSGTDSQPMIPKGHSAQGPHSPLSRRPRHPQSSRHRRESPSIPRGSHFYPREGNFPHPRDAFFFGSSQVPKHSNSRPRNRSLTRNEIPHPPQFSPIPIRREVSRNRHSLSPPRTSREPRPMLRREVSLPFYKDAPCPPRDPAFLPPTGLEHMHHNRKESPCRRRRESPRKDSPHHRESQRSRRRESPSRHQRRESPSRHVKESSSRHHRESPMRYRRESPVSHRRESLNTRESRPLQRENHVSYRRESPRVGNREPGSTRRDSSLDQHRNSIQMNQKEHPRQGNRDNSLNRRHESPRPRQRESSHIYETAHQFPHGHFDFKPRQDNVPKPPAKFNMNPDQWPWESFNNSGNDMRQSGTMRPDQSRSRDNSLTRHNEFISQRAEIPHSGAFIFPPSNKENFREGFMNEGATVPANTHNLNGRNFEHQLLNQMGGLNVAESLDEARERWERGQPDFSGRDSFQNIQAYIDERLKPTK